MLIVKRPIRFDVIGAFMLMLLMCTFFIDRIIGFIIRPYVIHYLNELTWNKPIDQEKIAYMARFVQLYYLLVFFALSLIALIILSIKRSFRQFIKEFGYAFLFIVVIQITVVVFMRVVFK